MKRLLRYLYGTSYHGILFYRDSPLALHVFFDLIRQETNMIFHPLLLNYIVYLRHNPISWSSKKQRTIVCSSTKVKCRFIVTTITKLNWVCYRLTKLYVQIPYSPMIFCYDVDATQLCSNLVFHSCMKHVAIDFYFIHNQV